MLKIFNFRYRLHGLGIIMYLCGMRKAIIFLFFPILTLVYSCQRPTGRTVVSGSDTLSIVTSHYNDDLYDQGRTECCWVYAMLACIETEQQRRGDSITLSRQWIISHSLREQAEQRFLMQIRQQSSAGKASKPVISSRGVGKDVLRLIDHYGLVPYAMERTRVNNSRVLERKLQLLADNKMLDIETLRERMDDLLPRFTVSKGLDQESSFYLYSMRYTPSQFAESIMYYQKWQWYASVKYRKWHEHFALEVPDNRYYHEYENLPPEELLSKVLSSLREGHPVYWEMSKKADAGNSDHAVAIMGLVRGKTGEERLLCRNSYGKKWGKNGYFVVSKSYFLHHTCNVGILQ